MADVLEQVIAVSRTRTTREEVIEHYKAEYPGQKTLKNGKTIYEWQSKLATDLSQVVGIKRESVMRRFQGQRLNQKISKGQQDEYQALGESLPPIPPGGGFHISGTVYVKFSDGECEEREVDETITGEEAAALVGLAYNQADRGIVQAIVNHYMEQDFDEEPAASVGSCQSPQLVVEPIEE